MFKSSTSYTSSTPNLQPPPTWNFGFHPSPARRKMHRNLRGKHRETHGMFFSQSHQDTNAPDHRASGRGHWILETAVGSYLHSCRREYLGTIKSILAVPGTNKTLGSSLIRLASDKAPNRTEKDIHVQNRGILENTLKTHNQWKIIKQRELHAIAIQHSAMISSFWSHGENVGAKPANCHEVSQSPCISYYSIIPCIHKF